MDRAQFEDLMSSFDLMAQQNILRDGHLTPVVLVVKDDKTAVIVLEYGSDEGKAAAFARVKFSLRRLKPDAAINKHRGGLGQLPRPEGRSLKEL